MARRAARITVDACKGVIIGQQVFTVFINGLPPAALGDPVESHRLGGKHKRPVMVTASGNVIANGVRICRQGDLASCGHGAMAGSPDTYVN